VQGDRDIMIVTEARGKPLDPSLPPRQQGVVPTTAKVGIDATISEGIPKERFERISYAYADTAKVEDYLHGKADTPGKIGDDAAVVALAEKILALIAKEPVYYTDIGEHFHDYAFGTVARAIGHLHKTERLWQDERGKMCVRGSKFAAKLPS